MVQPNASSRLPSAVLLFHPPPAGVASVLLFTITGIYVAATFRPDSLPKPMPCDPTENPNGFCISGDNVQGWSQIFVMSASLFTATVFSGGGTLDSILGGSVPGIHPPRCVSWWWWWWCVEKGSSPPPSLRGGWMPWL